MCMYVLLMLLSLPSLSPVIPSHKCVCPVLIMCFFLSVNSNLLSMLLFANASVFWYIIILILIAGIVWILFCMLLVPYVLLMYPFHMLCQCSLYANYNFWQCFLPLIDHYIYIWYFWYFVLSIILPVQPYMPPPPPVDTYLPPTFP